MFSSDYEMVVLIRKNRPAWQTGRLNGPGGKKESDETPLATVCREFREETGVLTEECDWDFVCEYQTPDCVIHFFATAMDCDVFTTTDEPVAWYSVNEALSDPTLIPHLRWIIPLAVHGHDDLLVRALNRQVEEDYLATIELPNLPIRRLGGNRQTHRRVSTQLAWRCARTHPPVVLAARVTQSTSR
jgi:8-oxo-dGTP diphosphatase